MGVELLAGSFPKNPPRHPAYQPHASGLIVPAELAREREVWTRADWQTLEKATKLLESRGLHLFIGCTDDRCQAQPVSRIRRNDGGLTLQCAHKSREVFRSL